MPKLIAPIYCPCCGHDRPHTDYRPNTDLCSLCSMLTPFEAVRLARETMRREYSISTQTKNGRKLARQAAKLAQYVTQGKRCTSCHAHKPVEAFNRCAPTSDGLQPACRACNEVRAAILRTSGGYGGLAQWHTVRDALRAKNGG